MEEKSIFEKLMDDDNDDIIELEPEGGKRQKFEQIALITYEDELYAILKPLELKGDQVVVFHLDEYDEDMLELVEDEELAQNVLDVYIKGDDEDEEE